MKPKVKRLKEKHRYRDMNPFFIGEMVEVFYTEDCTKSICGNLEHLDEDSRGPYVILAIPDGRFVKVPTFGIGIP